MAGCSLPCASVLVLGISFSAKFDMFSGLDFLQEKTMNTVISSRRIIIRILIVTSLLFIKIIN